jgi:hypothetical protein
MWGSQRAVVEDASRLIKELVAESQPGEPLQVYADQPE